MSRWLPPLRLVGATVLRDGILGPGDVGLCRGRISEGDWPAADFSGYLVLPGIVDLLCAGFERHVAPQGGLAVPLPPALRAADREAAAAGVTTAFLAQRWSWEGGIRGPDFAEALLAALEGFRTEALTDLEVAPVIETHSVGTADRFLSAAARYGLRLAFFADTIGEMSRPAVERMHPFADHAPRGGRSAAEYLAAMDAARALRAQVPRHLCTLATGFDGMGLRYGSLADADAETREHHSLIGARLCALPRCVPVARAASAVDDPILAQASAALPGAGTGGAPSVTDLVAAGLCDALVSCLHPPSLSAAAFALADAGLVPFPVAWAMLSATPARLTGLADRGRIAEGLRADITLIHAETRAVEMTVSGGRISHLSGEAALRIIAARRGRAVLAAE